jgi:hypothetical protein
MYPSEIPVSAYYPFCHRSGLKIKWEKTNLHTHYNQTGNRQSISRSVNFRRTFTYQEREVGIKEFKQWYDSYIISQGTEGQLYIPQPYFSDMAVLTNGTELSTSNQISAPSGESWQHSVLVHTLPNGKSYLLQQYVLPLLGGHVMQYREPIHYSTGLVLRDSTNTVVPFTDHLSTGEITGLNGTVASVEGTIVVPVRQSGDFGSYTFDSSQMVRIPQFDLVEIITYTDYSPEGVNASS